MLAAHATPKKATMFLKKTGLPGHFKALKAETDNTNVANRF